MGKKKQRVRWTSVEEKFFSPMNGEEETMSVKSNPHPPQSHFILNNKDHPHFVHKQYRNYQRPQPHSYPHSRRHGYNAIAPRFERKARQIEVNGEECEVEELPDGFTKIRSKNLDVLFKKDYYAQQKIDASRSTDSSRSNGSSIKGEDEEDEDQEQEEKQKDENEQNGGEEKKEESYQISSFSYSPSAMPFVPSSQRNPNLFLYSPTSNTMIPCEEIIIPHAVMGPDGGPVFQGPTNIYLAFPVDGSSSNGDSPNFPLNPHQQVLPYDQYGGPSFYPPPPQVAVSSTHMSYSPPTADTVNATTAYNRRTTFQSTSSECGTSTEPGSADSTYPHSPPEMSGYSPATWVAEQEPEIGHQVNHHEPQQYYNQAEENQCVSSWYQPPQTYITDDINAKGQPEMAQENQENHKIIHVDSKTQEEADQNKEPDTENESQQVIPGLHPDFASKRSQKKRKKKKKPFVNGQSTEDTIVVKEELKETPSEDPTVVKEELEETSSEDPTVLKEVLDEEVKKETMEDQDNKKMTFENCELKMDSIIEGEPALNPVEKEAIITTESQVVEETVKVKEEDSVDMMQVKKEESIEMIQNGDLNDEETKVSSKRKHISEDVESLANKGDDTSKDCESKKKPKSKKRRQQKRNKSAHEAKENVSSDIIIPKEMDHEEVFNQVEEVSSKKNDGEWETKKRKSKRRLKANPLTEITPQSEIEDTQDTHEDITTTSTDVISIKAEIPAESEPEKPMEPVDIQIELADDKQIGDASESAVDTTSIRRQTKKKRRKFASARYESGSAGAGTTGVVKKPVLIQDDILGDRDTGRRRIIIRRASSADAKIINVQENYLDTLFISSMGHGIDNGPIFTGRPILATRYMPPDRAEEIPIRFRQNVENDDDDENQQQEDIKKEDLDLD